MSVLTLACGWISVKTATMNAMIDRMQSEIDLLTARLAEVEHARDELQKSLRFTVDQGERREKELHEYRRERLAEQREQLDAFGRFGGRVAAMLTGTDRKTLRVADLTAMAVECGVEWLDR